MRARSQRTANWGLTLCSHLKCSVCETLGDQPEELFRLRELYVQGHPEWLLARFFNVSGSDLNHHAWRHNWARRRAINLPDPKQTFQLALLARLRATWHLASPTSADKMLELLAKSIGMGQKPEAEGKPALTWERLLAESRRQDEA